MTRDERTLRTFLRVCAAILLVALGAVVLPTPWMAAIHAWLSLGELPDQRIVGYLTRSLSGLYAFHGAVTWFLSCDVRRYGPLIHFQAILMILFGAGLGVLDMVVGLPAYWVVAEGPTVIVLGVVLLWLQGRCEDPPGAASGLNSGRTSGAG